MKIGDLVKKKCVVPWVGIVVAQFEGIERHGGKWIVRWSCGKQEPAWGLDIEVLNEAG